MRRQLVIVFVAVTTMVAIAFIVPLAVFVQDVALERAVDDADRDAAALFPVLAATDDVGALAVAVSRTDAGRAGLLSVHLPEGVTVGAPASADELVVAAQRDGRAFSGEVDGGIVVIAPVVRADGSIAVVRVFVPDAMLRDGVAEAWLVLGAVGAALVVVSVLLADRLARSITRPVSELAIAAHRLGEGDIAARVQPGGPAEVAEVGAAFNTLAGRVDELLHAEREDVADLAHRLRTPLAALRLQLEMVDDQAVRRSLASSADDLARVLDAVIVEARRRSRATPVTPIDFGAAVRERAAFWSALADEQGRATTIELAQVPLPVAIAAGELDAALDVLLENIFSHTPDGTPFAVAVRRDGTDAVCDIADAGPGFTRDAVRGASATSTGLGLDIARRYITAAGGAFSVGVSSSGGALVHLRLPLAIQSPR